MHALIALGLFVGALAEERILVMGWSVGTGVELPHALLDEVLDHSVRRHSGAATVTSLRDVGALLDLEQAKDLVGCDDVTCTAEIGLALDADRIVMGAIGRIGGRTHLALKIVESRSAKVVHRINASTRDESMLPRLIGRAVAWLLVGDDARAGASALRGPDLIDRHEIQRGRVTQRWVTIKPEPPVPFRVGW